MEPTSEPAALAPSENGAALLEVRDLEVTMYTPRGPARVIDGLSLTVDRGETLGIVGESGCGKSITALALLSMIPPPGEITGGTIRFAGQDLRSLRPREMAKLRGRDLAIVFQDPMTSLNPVLTVGTQICETLQHHLGLDSGAARARALELLEAVEIVDAKQRLKSYPHELSGGMRQRVLIAIALACEPKLLIADEPTTALDVTTQVQIMELLADAQKRLGMAMILISHDMAVIAEEADRVAVMYAGKVAEVGDAADIVRRPRHRYTEALVNALPVIGKRLSSAAVVGGRPPDLRTPPSGCRFHPRCPHVLAECRVDEPVLAVCSDEASQAAGRAPGGPRLVACWNPTTVRGGAAQASPSDHESTGSRD
jgi:oligopeptide/dipeptide ABC transporter ATP-binding protein